MGRTRTCGAGRPLDGLLTEVLLHHIRRDLLAHVGGRLHDDAALIAIHRPPAPPPSHRLGRIIHAGGADSVSGSSRS